MPSIRITPREFQLVLLRRMADYHPELVERARGSLGATATEMREVNAHWQRMVRSPHYRPGLSALRGFLGAPVSEQPHRVGDLTCQIARWRLSLWPDLLYEAVAAPGGGTLAELLVRDPAAPPPRLERLSDLEPWSCVVGDLERAFSPARDPTLPAERWRVLFTEPPSRWTVLFTAPGDDGKPVGAVAQFVWGLLQNVQVEGESVGG